MTGPAASSRQRVCLSMIVRDEAHVVQRCLRSVKPAITDWCVIDTGSTDGTPELVHRELAGVPGHLWHRPWRDFGFNRTEAMHGARLTGAEYALVVDADDFIRPIDGTAVHLPVLTSPAYLMRIRDGDLEYLRKQLFRLDLPWRYVGVAHEYAECVDSSGAIVEEASLLEEYEYMRVHEGARHKDRRATLERDAQLLRDGVLAEPLNARYVFYLAQTLNELGESVEALGWYTRRIAMGGWAEEVFYSKLQAGRILVSCPGSEAAGTAVLLEASQDRPWRAEPLSAAAHALNRAGRYREALQCAKQASRIDRPSSDVLFIELPAYGPNAMIQAIIAYRGLGQAGEAIAAAEQVLGDPATTPLARAAARDHLAALTAGHCSEGVARSFRSQPASS